MKKLLTALAISALALTSTFAATEPTTTTNGTTGYVTLNSTLNPTAYSLTLKYGDDTFSDKKVDNLDLTEDGTSEVISVLLSGGNLNNSVTYTTTVTENQFKGVVDKKSYTTDNALKVLDMSGKNTKEYTSVVPAGPQDEQNVAQFKFSWTGDEDLPAGEYSTTNTISVTVN